MIIESWYKIWCPKCDAHNWICNGDESDLSGIIDIEAVKCRKCDHIFWFGYVDDNPKIIEDSNWELGIERPN